MSIYAKWRMTEGYAQDGISPFFVVRSGARLKDGSCENPSDASEITHGSAGPADNVLGSTTCGSMPTPGLCRI